MISKPAPSASQNRRRKPPRGNQAQARIPISKAKLRRSPRLAKQSAAVQTSSLPWNITGGNLSEPRQAEPRSLSRRRTVLPHPDTKSVQRISQPSEPKTTKRTREADELAPSHDQPEPCSKRIRTSAVSAPAPARWMTIADARIDYWRKNGSWSREEQEKAMDSSGRPMDLGLARTRSSLSRKRSNSTMRSEPGLTPATSFPIPREQKSAPYTNKHYATLLEDRGSFFEEHPEGHIAQSGRLCQTLQNAPQLPPQHTLFSKNELFKKTCARMRGENETKVIRDIAQLIVPSAEILADDGLDHLEILRETTNACWTCARQFLRPRPQPDFGLGFKSLAFSDEQREKLRPFIGNPLKDSSYIAATPNMYLPFLTSEVKCGESAVDLADRQNIHSQTVALRGLIELFRCVNREKELHREINGFSISHDDRTVRIWGHYAEIDGSKYRYYRHEIADFGIKDGDNRWRAYKFVRNVYDLWVPGHFKRICSIIDQMPLPNYFTLASRSDSQLSSMAPPCSGMSQQLQRYSLTDDGESENEESEDEEPNVRLITPDTSVHTEGSRPKRNRKPTEKIRDALSRSVSRGRKPT